MQPLNQRASLDRRSVLEIERINLTEAASRELAAFLHSIHTISKIWAEIIHTIIAGSDLVCIVKSSETQTTLKHRGGTMYELAMKSGGQWTNDGYGDSVVSDHRGDIVRAAVALRELGDDWAVPFGVVIDDDWLQVEEITDAEIDEVAGSVRV